MTTKTLSLHVILDIFYSFSLSEDVVVAVSLSGMLNIWMLKPNIESKVQLSYIKRHNFVY